MDPLNLMPAYQPLPFPLPVCLAQILLVAGLYLHALPMNVVLGGGFVTALMLMRGQADKSSYPYRAAKALAMGLPLFISVAITQGIVPLLFLQLLYGPAFYTSSILLAVPWLAVVFIILTAYYIAYLIVYRCLKKEDGRAGCTPTALLVMGAAFAFVGFMFSNNTTLMLTPEKWAPIYLSSARGVHLNLGEPQLLPRYLHFFLSSFAVVGLTLGCFGLYWLKPEEQYGRWLVRRGSQLFLGATLLNIPVGLWFLFKGIKAEYTALFLGGNQAATAVLISAAVLLLLSIVFTAVSSVSGRRAAFIGGLVSSLALIATMVVNRHNLRLFSLNPFLNPDSAPTATQWDLLSIFLVLTVAAIAYLVWLTRLVWSAYHKDAVVEKNSEP